MEIKNAIKITRKANQDIENILRELESKFSNGCKIDNVEIEPPNIYNGKWRIKISVSLVDSNNISSTWVF